MLPRSGEGRAVVKASAKRTPLPKGPDRDRLTAKVARTWHADPGRCLRDASGRPARPAGPAVALRWACQDLNLGPHPYQQTAGKRCADRRFRRSCPTVGGEVIGSNGVQ